MVVGEFAEICAKLSIMKNLTNQMLPILTLLCVILLSPASLAQEADPVDQWLTELSNPETEDWERVEERVLDAWSRSGSTAMDLLLERGRDALEEDDYTAALEHFSALTDHAPDFAEGWNMRATAFYLMEEYGLSIEDIGRTLALNPKHFGALSGLGVILEQIGETDEALLAYRTAFEINPHRENLIEAIERLTNDVDGTPI